MLETGMKHIPTKVCIMEVVLTTTSMVCILFYSESLHF
jgi:hypothetical protein